VLPPWRERLGAAAVLFGTGLFLLTAQTDQAESGIVAESATRVQTVFG
jgi:hypothetical protein